LGVIVTADKLAAGEAIDVASSKRGHITVDTLVNLIQDELRQGRKPVSIVLSKRDRRDVNQDIMAMNRTGVAKADENSDDIAIGVLMGVQIGWNRLVQNGKCFINYKA
jgi:hypothetical protein